MFYRIGHSSPSSNLKDPRENRIDLDLGAAGTILLPAEQTVLPAGCCGMLASRTGLPRYWDHSPRSCFLNRLSELLNNFCVFDTESGMNSMGGLNTNLSSFYFYEREDTWKRLGHGQISLLFIPWCPRKAKKTFQYHFWRPLFFYLCHGTRTVTKLGF